MKLEYSSKKIEQQCNILKEAQKLFGGNRDLALSLLARTNALRQAKTLHDIIVIRHFRFHNLKNKKGKDYSGYYAIDVKTKRYPWRIILQPLDENLNSYRSKSIDQIAKQVKIIEILEVSNHYE